MDRKFQITLEGKEYLLDIEQAKKLNLLKEKDNRVRSWKEFKEKYYNGGYGYFYEAHSDKVMRTASPMSVGDQLTPYEAKAISAFSKLLKLRRDWIGEWEPDWSDVSGESKGVVWVCKNKVAANTSLTISKSLSFPSYQMAKEFLETFRDLLEEAKILI